MRTPSETGRRPPASESSASPRSVSFPSSRAPRARRLLARAREFERDHRPLLVLLLAYTGAAMIADAFLGRGRGAGPSALVTAGLLSVIYLAVGAAAFATRLQFRERRRPGALLRLGTWREFGASWLHGRWVDGFVLVALLVGPFREAFIYFKSLIPVLQPFAWDRRFADWDRALHFGRDPWELLHGWLGHPAVTDLIDIAYHVWFPLGVLLVTWQAFAARGPLRMQFLVSYVLVWIVLGTGTATLLSSAGPCYYGLVTGDETRFAALMTYLADVHRARGLLAVETMEFLWDGYEGRSPINFGISAMPSVHVALSVLYAILGWKTAHWLGVALTAFAAIILIGSVHLAWHYALDGYVSIVATVLLWLGAGRVLRRRRALRAGAAPA